MKSILVQILKGRHPLGSPDFQFFKKGNNLGPVVKLVLKNMMIKNMFGDIIEY